MCSLHPSKETSHGLKTSYKFITALTLLSLLLGSCGQQKTPLQIPTQDSYLRIVVPTTGYYRLVIDDLIKLGLPDPDLSKLNLYHMGNPYPFWVVESEKIEDTIIYFYAPPPEKVSNIKEIVFILAIGGQATAKRLYPLNTLDEIGEDIQFSTVTMIQHLEEQNLYLPDSKGDDHWYWAMITSKDEVEVKISIPKIESIDLKIHTHLWSPSNNPGIDPDHSLRIIANQSDGKNINWDGKGSYTAEMMVTDLENTSEISLKLLTNELTDQIPQKMYLDWIKLEYQMPLRLSGETLQFKTDQDLVIKTNQMDGFLFASTNDKTPIIYQMPVESIIKIPNPTETNFSWIPESGFKEVSTIQVIEPPQVSLAPVDYLIIAPKALHHSLKPLLNFRHQQGYQTALFSTQEIYDSYTSGTPSPFAIQSFIRQLFAKSSENLKYLLLVGDYTYEMLDYESSLDILPSFFVDTSFAGETVSDSPFADLDGDNKPDLAIGRVPTSDANQLTIWIDQLLNYEMQSANTLQYTISVSDPSSSTFQDSARSFLESLDTLPGKSGIHLTGEVGWIEKNQPVFAEKNSLVAYFGHGSIDRWGQQPILSSRQIQEMEASFNPAFIFSFSCLNGYFIHPETKSLTETLLFHPNSATVAVLASTSLTLHESQIQFSNQIISELQLGGKVNIGDLVTSAMREIDSESQLNRDVINTFILFGDPATSFPSIQTPQGN